TELKNKIVVIASLEGLVQLDNMGMVDIFDNNYFFGDHLSLLLTHRLYFYHLYGIPLEFTLFTAFKNLTCRT
ncbi:MAG: hypothetical protein ACKO96_01630, partial [Flammeovirgaceae bacterium]